LLQASITELKQEYSDWETVKTALIGTNGQSQALAPISITGSINGANQVFTLAKVPTFFMFYRNGLLLNVGVGNDYIVSGDTITMASAPGTGDTLYVAGY